MKFKFQDDLPYQLDAINSVVDLFDGQPQDAEKLATRLQGRVPETDSESQASLDVVGHEVLATGASMR